LLSDHRFSALVYGRAARAAALPVRAGALAVAGRRPRAPRGRVPEDAAPGVARPHGGVRPRARPTHTRRGGYAGAAGRIRAHGRESEGVRQQHRRGARGARRNATLQLPPRAPGGGRVGRHAQVVRALSAEERKAKSGKRKVIWLYFPLYTFRFPLAERHLCWPINVSTTTLVS